MTPPPSPPSPPDGPPRGTYFSRRKARQPFPPISAFTRIVASSINIKKFDFPLCTLVSFVVQAFELHQPQRARRSQRKPKQKAPPEGEALQTACRGRPRPRGNLETLLHGDGFNHHVLTKLTPVLEHNLARDLGK